ncbi:MAG: HEAT repeat domain-containing protein [Candidatus Thorarchaeota archaeon]
MKKNIYLKFNKSKIIFFLFFFFQFHFGIPQAQESKFEVISEDNIITEDNYEPPLFLHFKELWLIDSIKNEFTLDNDLLVEKRIIESHKIYMDEEIIKEILTYFDDLHKFQKWKYLDTIGWLSSFLQVPLLQDLLVNDPSFGVRVKSAMFLGNLNSKESINTLRQAANSDTNIRVRLSATQALINLDDYQFAYNSLNKIWKISSGNHQIDCIKGFRDLGNNEAINSLIDIIKESREGIEY